MDGPRLAHDFRRAVAVFEFKRRLVLGEISIGLRAAGFEERDLQAGLRKAFAGPASGRTGTDNDNVKGIILVLGHRIKIRSGC